MKRRTPLQRLWKSVDVVSLSNGMIQVTPAWLPPNAKQSEDECGGPGLITRMFAARQLQKLIDGHLRKGRK